MLTYAEAATEFYSPCCEGHGVYADFECNGEDETLIGFRCTECGKNYPREHEFGEH